MSDRRDRERDRKRDRDDRDRDRDRDRLRHRNTDYDRERDRDRDRDRDRKDRTKRSHTPDRGHSRHTRSRTRSPDHHRSRSRSTDKHRSSRRSHHRTPSPDQSRKRRKHTDDTAAVVSEFVDGIAKEKQQQKSSKDVEMVEDDDGNVGGGEMDESEIEMMKMMGIPVGFDSTKGKPVDGNDVSGIRAVTKRQPRQYMNRRGGFNRPLPAEVNR